MQRLTILVAAVMSYAVIDYPGATLLEEQIEFAKEGEAVETENVVSGGNGADEAGIQVTVTGTETLLAEENPIGNTLYTPQKIQDGAMFDDDIIYRVAFPTGATACLDPSNLSGKGQIFSEEYEIENYGNTDIVIKINTINISYGYSEVLYEIIEQPIADYRTETKKMNVDMVWRDASGDVEKILHIVEGTPEEYVLHLKASEYNSDNEFVKLREGSRGSFSFCGTLNANPNIVWEDGEIIVHFDYEIISIKGENGLEEGGLLPAEIPGVLEDKPDQEGEEQRKNTVSSGDSVMTSGGVSGNDPLI